MYGFRRNVWILGKLWTLKWGSVEMSFKMGKLKLFKITSHSGGQGNWKKSLIKNEEEEKLTGKLNKNSQEDDLTRSLEEVLTGRRNHRKFSHTGSCHHKKTNLQKDRKKALLEDGINLPAHKRYFARGSVNFTYFHDSFFHTKSTKTKIIQNLCQTTTRLLGIILKHFST